MEKQKSELPRMLTIRQAAATGILPELAIRRLVREQKIPFVRTTPGRGRAYINYDALVDFLNVGEVDEP